MEIHAVVKSASHHFYLSSRTRLCRTEPQTLEFVPGTKSMLATKSQYVLIARFLVSLNNLSSDWTWYTNSTLSLNKVAISKSFGIQMLAASNCDFAFSPV